MQTAEAAMGQMTVYRSGIPQRAQAADLPIEQVSKYERAVNIPITRRMGICMPQTWRCRAHEVIK